MKSLVNTLGSVDNKGARTLGFKPRLSVLETEMLSLHHIRICGIGQ